LGGAGWGGGAGGGVGGGGGGGWGGAGGVRPSGCGSRVDGYRRADGARVLAPLDGIEPPASTGPSLVDGLRSGLVAVFGDAASAAFVSNETKATRQRLLHATGARGTASRGRSMAYAANRAMGPSCPRLRSGAPELEDDVLVAPASDPQRDRLPTRWTSRRAAGPEIGRLPRLIAEERAAGTISTARGGPRAVRREQTPSKYALLRRRFCDRTLRPDMK